MVLSARFAGKFSSGVRKRGQDYYVRRRVRIQRGSDSDVEAAVQGSQRYYVELIWSGDQLSVSCECPYFFDNGLPCKHLWAAILAAEAQRYLSKAAAAANPKMECDLDDGDWSLEERSSVAPHPHPPIFNVPAPPPPAWRRQVSEIVNSQKVIGAAVAWPSQREILYVVDTPSSVTRGDLVLTLQSRDRKADGGWKLARNLSLKREQVEEKVLELQKTMRDLAAAIIGADNSLIRNLRPDVLALRLS